MFDRMQYIIGLPEKIERLSFKYAIKDFEGNSIGNIISNKYKSYGLMPLMEWRYIDDHGNCQGILRQRKPGIVVVQSPPLDILGPQDDTRGRIEFHGGYYNKTTGTIHSGSRILFDALNNQLASSDPYTYKSNPGSKIPANFEHFQKNGLNIRAPDGRTIATLRNSGGVPGCQIDLFPPIADAFLVLSMGVHVLI